MQHILRTVVTQYLILTKEEVALWQEDSLKFFLYMKYQSNEVKGNLLRDKARGLIAGIQLRFSQVFEDFCANVITELAGTAVIPDIEKEAMLQLVEIRLNDEDGIDSTQFLGLLAPELQKPGNFIVKRKVL